MYATSILERSIYRAEPDPVLRPRTDVTGAALCSGCGLRHLCLTVGLDALATKAFEQVVLKFAPKPITFAPGTHPSAIVDPSVQLGERVSIQPLAVIEAGAKIGDDTIIGAGGYVGHETVIGSACHIYPHVTIRERSRIGSRVIIHSGAVIGADGFGFEMVDGRHQKIQQLGIVQIDDDVEIGANTTVDRARFGRT